MMTVRVPLSLCPCLPNPPLLPRATPRLSAGRPFRPAGWCVLIAPSQSPPPAPLLLLLQTRWEAPGGSSEPSPLAAGRCRQPQAPRWRRPQLPLERSRRRRPSQRVVFLTMTATTVTRVACLGSQRPCRQSRPLAVAAKACLMTKSPASAEHLCVASLLPSRPAGPPVDFPGPRCALPVLLSSYCTALFAFLRFTAPRAAVPLCRCTFYS